MPLPLGLAPLGFLELDPVRLIDVAAKAGFSSVALRMRAAVPGGPEYPLPIGSAGMRETKARMRDSNVGVLQAELVGLARSTDVQACRALCESAAEVGATRIVASGDDADMGIVADKLGELCDLAAEYRLAVDIEFMPFRALMTLAMALDVIRRAGRPNAFVMVDALHLYRSGGSVADVAAADRSRIGVYQICDAPLTAPPADQLATEARERRLLPGHGELPLHALMDALPPGTPVAAEIPLMAQFPDLTPLERARRIYDAAVPFITR